MLRKLLVLGVVAVTAAIAVPVLHERNPDALGEVVRAFLESDDQKSRLSLPSITAGRADVASRTEPLIGKKVRVSAGPRGHYMAEFKLNGRTVNALVDTGATFVAINRSTARRIGIAPAPAEFHYEINTANGTTEAAVATIDSLQIGRIRVEDVQTVVLEDAALDGSLVGLSFLNKLARFQVEDGALILEQ